MSGNPEDLLRSALEKIVFFECRVSQLEAEVQAARVTAARARTEAADARRREVERETALAALRGEHATVSSRNEELADRVRLLEGERERFLSGLIEQARVAGAAPAADGEADLAGFIAELRAEVERLKAWKAAAEAAGISIDAPGAKTLAELRARSAEAVPALADEFRAAGRVGLSDEEARRLGALFATRAERALYESSMRDLSSADPGERGRAAECLRALGSKAAAPLLAAALGREPEAEVKTAILSALAAIAEPGAADLAARELNDPRPAVRVAALEATATLGREAAEPRLLAALADESPLVRRRAALLLGFARGQVADEALASALSDSDRGVARAAAVALSGRPTARAQRALARAIAHAEPSVRRAAAEAVARWSGETVDAAAPEPDRRRASRRIAEKLATLDETALREAVTRVPATSTGIPFAPGVDLAQRDRNRGAAIATLNANPNATPNPNPNANPNKTPNPNKTATAVARAPARAAVAVLEPSPASGALEATLVGEVRAALRGRSAAELSELAGADPGAVEGALAALVARGTLVARGARFFTG